MIGSASPRVLQGACSSYPPKKAVHSTLEGIRNLRFKGACPRGAHLQLFPSGIKVSPLSQEGPRPVRCALHKKHTNTEERHARHL